ncbi:MAG TPA: RHS repeat-associated core domain-containing protein [Anaerolineales bacterium]
MRIDSTLYYTLKDHLGSASVVTDASGNVVGEQRYYPYGETRLTTGSIFTDRLFTGQREMAGLGIYHYNARFYSPYINQFLSADTIVPGFANPQNLNRYSYVNNNPLRYTDPTGHLICLDDEICFNGGGGGSVTSSGSGGGGGGGDEPDWEDLDDSGYSDWETQILQELYNNGGQYAETGVWSIINNNIHIAVGDPLECEGNPYGLTPSCQGDWQSLFAIGGWYDSVNNYVFLNPSQGYVEGEMPSIAGLSIIVHEAVHVTQGFLSASTAYGELEAWQIGFQVLDELNGPANLSDTQQAIVDLPLNHDPMNLTTAVNLMMEDQQGQYLGGYLLYFTIPYFPVQPRP